jgi:hypothetical protein
MDDIECLYCLMPERFGLLPADEHFFRDHDHLWVNKRMHLEINGVSTSAGVECKIQKV